MAAPTVRLILHELWYTEPSCVLHHVWLRVCYK